MMNAITVDGLSNLHKKITAKLRLGLMLDRHSRSHDLSWEFQTRKETLRLLTNVCDVQVSK